MKGKAQERPSSLLVLAAFLGLQVPLKKRFVAGQIPGNRGGEEGAAEALVQGAGRRTAAVVLLASEAVRASSGGGLIGNRRRADNDGAAGKDREERGDPAEGCTRARGLGIEGAKG